MNTLKIVACVLVLMPSIVLGWCEPCVSDPAMVWDKWKNDYMNCRWPHSTFCTWNIYTNYTYNGSQPPGSTDIYYDTSLFSDDYGIFCNGVVTLSNSPNVTAAGNTYVIFATASNLWPSGLNESARGITEWTEVVGQYGKLQADVYSYINFFHPFAVSWSQIKVSSCVRHELAHSMGFKAPTDDWVHSQLSLCDYALWPSYEVLSMNSDEQAVYNGVYSQRVLNCCSAHNEYGVVYCGGYTDAKVCEFHVVDGIDLTP